MRILLLNQFIPPDASPTARLLGEIRETLEDSGHETILVGNPDGYRKTGDRFRTRFGRDLLTLANLLFRGLAAGKVNAVIAFSSPPCLLVVASLVARRHRAKLFHWCMDLYPDLAVALGVIKESHPVHKWIRSLTDRALRRCDLVVALDDDMADRLRKTGVSPEVLAPWPPAIVTKELDRSENTSPNSKPFTWLYSGNLGRAHEWETLLEAQKLIEQDPDQAAIELVFQGGGAARENALQHAEHLGLAHCHWRGYASDDAFLDSLSSAGALVVTQRPQVRGMLWPSKIALITEVSRPIIWVGDTGGAIADFLGRNSRACIAAPGEAEKIAAFIKEQADAGGPAPKSTRSADEIGKAIEAVRSRGMEQWKEWLEGNPA